MRVILDTNVFISGIFFTGPPFRILRAWREGILQLVVSPGILEEYQRVAEELAVQFPVIDWRPIIDFVTVNAMMVPDIELAWIPMERHRLTILWASLRND